LPADTIYSRVAEVDSCSKLDKYLPCNLKVVDLSGEYDPHGPEAVHTRVLATSREGDFVEGLDQS
jgi:hypothetical protein